MTQSKFLKLIIVILLAGAAVYFATQSDLLGRSFIPPIINRGTVQTTKPSSSITTTPFPTDSWETYTSAVFGYSFKYPKSWSISMFDENNPDILFGSNSLQNYSPTEVEKYMDHGLINWSSFIQDKPAIKVDFGVYSRSTGPNQFQNKSELLNTLINQSAHKLDVSDIVIGGQFTEQYKATDNLGPTDVPEVNTFVAYPDDDRVIYVNLLFWNISSYELLKETPEWLELTQILATFKFTN